MNPMEEEIPLDDIPDEQEAPAPVPLPSRKQPAYFEESESFSPFDSGSPFTPASTSLSTDTQS